MNKVFKSLTVQAETVEPIQFFTSHYRGSFNSLILSKLVQHCRVTSKMKGKYLTCFLFCLGELLYMSHG